MKKFLLSALFFYVLVVPSLAKEKSTNLLPINKLADFLSFSDKSLWEMWFSFEKEEYKPLDPEYAENIVSNWIAKSADDTGKPAPLDVEKLKIIKDNSEDIIKAMKSMKLLNGTLCTNIPRTPALIFSN